MPGKLRRRPISEAQRRWAYSTAAGDTDAPKKVGREFIAADKGGKLPPRKTKKLKRKK